MTRKILDFMKSPSGKFIIFFLVVIILAMVFSYYKSLPEKNKNNDSSFNDAVSIDRDYVRFRDGYEPLQSGKNEALKTKLERVVEKKEKETGDLEKRLNDLEKALAQEKARNTLLQIKVPEQEKKQEEKKEAFSLSPVNLYSAKVTKKKEPANQELKDYAPFGRLIKCQLVNTVDSSSFDTPIIGLVTENLWHDGKIIIPAGTEVHGKAASLTQRNRIAAEKEWMLVWRTQTKENGFELPVQALALDYSQDIQSGRYSITDGSAGLRGDIIETEQYAKLKLYAALFLKGAAEGISDLILEEAKSQDQNTVINSSQNQNGKESSKENQLKVGIAKGAQQAIDLYAKEMLDAISRDGVFVRVPAGRFFYVYITQTIDKNKAFPGASTNGSAPQPEVNDQESDVKDAQNMLLSLTRKRLEQEEKDQKKEESK